MHSHSSGANWVSLIITELVRPAYWGGLQHFNSYTDALFDLVAASEYFRVFSTFAGLIAPDKETKNLLLAQCLVLEREDIRAEWLKALGNAAEPQGAFTKFRNTVSLMETWLTTHAIQFPDLEPPPFTRAFSAEASCGSPL